MGADGGWEDATMRNEFRDSQIPLLETERVGGVRRGVSGLLKEVEVVSVTQRCEKDDNTESRRILDCSLG